jgi:deoxyribonuclease (pyrimidine dimer)
MTRLNLISPSLLTDQHLLAEYKELTQVHGSLKRTLESSKGLDKSRIAKVCPLNGGHVYFFYDKLGYLNKRYLELATEMHKRGFKADAHIKHWGRINAFPLELYGDYSPSKEEKDYLKTRIIERINQKKQWYRYKGAPLNSEYLSNLRDHY